MRLIQVLLLLVGFGGTSCRDEKQYVSKFRNAAVFRAQRASQDEFSTIINQLAVSARLITAITLQNGLIDGSIPSDKALAELLNIESIDLAQLESFDKTKVDGFVGKLKALGPSIAADNVVLTIEDMLALMNKMRIKYTELGDLSDTSSAKSFFAVVKNANTPNFNKSFVADILNAADVTQAVLNGMPSLSTQSNFEILADLIKLRNNSLKMIDAPQKIIGLTDQLEKLKDVTGHEFTRKSPQLRFVHFLDVFYAQVTKFSGRSPNDYDKLISLFSNATSLEPDAKSCGKEGDVVGAVVLSKRGPRYSRRQYTNGFLNGYLDITRLANDVNNPQFKMISQGFDFDESMSRLLPLQSLMDSAANVEKKLTMLPETFRAMRLVSEIIRNLASSGKLPEKAAFTKINSCIKPQSTSVFYKDIAAFFNDTKLFAMNLDVAISTAKKLPSSSLFSKVAEFTELNNTIKFSSDDANIMNKEAPVILGKIDKKLLATVAKAIVDTRTDLEKLATAVSEVVGLLASLSKQTSVVTKLLGHADTKKIVAFFECLKSTDLESVYSAIKLTREIREFSGDPKLASDIATSTSVIDGAKTAVKTLQSASAALKENPNPESKTVSSLKDFEKEASNFGDSVLALDHVRHVLEKKDQLKKFLEDRSGVEEEIDNVKDPQLKSELKEEWGLFGTTKHDMSELLADLEKRREQMKIPKASKFADYGSVFSAMNGLKDVDLQVANRLKVLKTLGATNQTLNNMKAQLEQLEDLDLQFARFNKPLSAMTATLDNLDKIFKSLSEANGQQNGSNSSRVSDSNSDFDFLYILILIGIVAFVIIGGILLWIFCKKRKGKKTAKKDGAPIVQNGTGTTGTSTQNEKGQTGGQGGGKKEKSASSNKTDKAKKAKEYDFTPKNDTDRAAKIFRELCWDYRNEKQVKEDEEDDSYGVEHNGFDDLMKLEISDKRTLVEQWYDKLIRAQPHTGTQIVNFNRFLGSALRFCLDTQPDSNKDKGLWYPANIIKLPMWSSMIVAQGPMKKEGNTKDDTRPAFWHMTFANLVEHIVMVCGLKEVSEYFPIEVGTSKKYGDYEVTLKSEDKFTDSVDTRVLIVVNSKTKEERRVKHWNITSWPQGRKLPENGMELLLSMTAVLNATRMQENPVIVHGTDSTGRTAAYVGAEYIFQKFFDKAKGHPTLPLILAELRAMCSTLFKHGFHLFYAGLAGCYCLNSASKMQVISQFTLNLNLDHYLHFFEANGDLDAKDRRYLEKHKKRKELGKMIYGVLRSKTDKARDATVEVSATDLRPTVSEAEGAAAKASTNNVEFDKTPVEEVQSTQ